MRSLLTGLAALLAGLLALPAAAQPYAYVPNFNSNNVSVIDTATNTVINTIALPGAAGAHGVVVNAAGTKVYFANFNNASVSVLDIATGTASAAVAVPGMSQPTGFAVNPAGTRAYVTGYGSANVAVFDLTPTTITLLTTLTGFSQPLGVAVNSAGTRAYVADRLNFRVAVIDTATQAVSFIATPGTRPWAIALDASGSNAWISSYDNGAVRRISNLAGSPIVDTPIAHGGGPTGIAISPDGSTVYVANELASTVSAIATGSGTLITTVAAGMSPRGVSVTPDGSKVLVANYSSNNIITYNASLGAPVATPVGTTPYALGLFIAPSPTADITGTITNSLGGGAMSGISVANSGAPSTSSNGSGVYSFTGLAAGSYTITPSVYNYVFSPLSRTVNLAGVNATGQNFVGTYDGIPDITTLRALVVAANLDPRLRNSLLVPLDASLTWLNGSNPNRVQNSCSNLAKFIALVRQNITAGKLPAATGNPWVVEANDILALSGCPTR